MPITPGAGARQSLPSVVPAKPSVGSVTVQKFNVLRRSDEFGKRSESGIPEPPLPP